MKRQKKTVMQSEEMNEGRKGMVDARKCGDGEGGLEDVLHGMSEDDSDHP